MHRTEEFYERNYKKYTEEEFLELVNNIAKQCGVDNVPDVVFYEEGEGTIGCCFINKIGDNYSVVGLAFDVEILNGRKYTIYQVDKIIRHELAHLIATLRHNDDCNHDHRWKKVVKEIGGEPSETSGFSTYAVRFHLEQIKGEGRTHHYYLSCSNCGKMHLETDTFKSTFQFFALSGTDFPYHVQQRGLRLKTDCCGSCYTFEAKAESFLQELINSNQLQDTQKVLKKLITSTEST